MVKTIFTSEQRRWLQPHAREYNRRVQKLVPGETGSQYARARAEQFASRWSSLADGQVTTREEIITAGRNFPPLLNIGNAYSPNASQFEKEGNEKAETSASTALRREEQEPALAEGQARYREDQEMLDEQIMTVNQNRKFTNRQLLKASLERVLQIYSNKTDASFYVLMSLPSDKINQSPIVSRFECSSMPEFPNFQTYSQTEQAILKQWKTYAGAIEKRRALLDRVKDMLTLDEEGYPEIPPVNYNLKEVGEILTTYLEYTWYKLHENTTAPQTVHDISWAGIESNPTKYINVAMLPSLLLPFRMPTEFTPEQILGLRQFLEQNANRPFAERFPFIVQLEEGNGAERVNSPLPPSSPPPLSTPSTIRRQTIIPGTTPQNPPLMIPEKPEKNKRPRVTSDDHGDTAELLRAAKIRRQQT
ncbi:hypothetical protein Clacol_008664 [Clathrus columnatus]|uniref:Uncharacterized protein n=1 Tax=Clathrus columnatus TaxID=1419009 RepID=A0AAV5AJ58_9AGAM|nr:hypothetical protein Clacol_008664 [Clathrus columnatus]